MTAPLPSSWQTGQDFPTTPTYLTMPATLLPDAKYLFAERTDATRAPNNERWSANQSDAADMTFATEWRNIIDPNVWQFLYTAIVGGFNPTAGAKFAPFKHPYRPGYFAKDVVSIGSIALNDGASPGGVTASIQPYQLAEVRVSFEQLPYKVYATGTATPLASANFLSIEDRGANDRLQMPGGAYVFTDGGASTTGRRAIQGLWLNRRLLYKVVTLHRIPEQLLYGSSDTSFITTKPTFFSNVGYVNMNSIFGCDADKLLLDSVETRVYGGHPLKEFKEYEVVLNFLYADNIGGFNAAFDIVTQTFQPVSSSLSGGTPPFARVKFEDFINNLNPVSFPGATF